MKLGSIFNIISCSFLSLSIMFSVILIPTNVITAHAETHFTTELDRIFSNPKNAELYIREQREMVEAVVEWWCEAPVTNTIVVAFTVCSLCYAPVATVGTAALFCGAAVVDELIVGDRNGDCKVDEVDVREALEEQLESLPNHFDFGVGDITLTPGHPSARATILPRSCLEAENDSSTEPR